MTATALVHERNAFNDYQCDASSTWLLRLVTLCICLPYICPLGPTYVTDTHCYLYTCIRATASATLSHCVQLCTSANTVCATCCSSCYWPNSAMSTTTSWLLLQLLHCWLGYISLYIVVAAVHVDVMLLFNPVFNPVQKQAHVRTQAYTVEAHNRVSSCVVSSACVQWNYTQQLTCTGESPMHTYLSDCATAIAVSTTVSW